MLRRDITDELLLLLKEYPVVTVLGPRQSGKTTLVLETLTEYEYSNLELPETRELASTDPKAYLAGFRGPVIIDEIQRVPELLSYIQVAVDERRHSGQYVLTGSHQLRLSEAVSQSLAGRTAILTLLPFSIRELSRHEIRFETFEEYCFRGFLPRLYDKSLRPSTLYANYYQTYVERDVRQLIHIRDMTLFEKLLKLLAGRVGQILDFSSLAGDVGIDAKTVRNWLSILEASYILFRLPPYFENFGKRVIKSPKYYFTDVGLLCYLLGIRTPAHVTRDPLRGNIFENLVVLEGLKSRLNAGARPDLYYFRDSNGNEVDVIHQDGPNLVAVEIKSASTFSPALLTGLNRFRNVSKKVKDAYLVYTGAPLSLSDGNAAVPFQETHTIFSE